MRQAQPRLEAPFAWNREFMPRLTVRRSIADDVLVFAVIVLVLVGAVSWFAGPAAGPGPIILPERSGHITLGSAKSDVERIQGKPTTRGFSVWQYGNSHVYFRDDRVVGWLVAPGYGLKLRLLPGKNAATAAGYFMAGSTKDEVAAAQGTPGGLQGDVWQYGPAKVFFKGSQVVGWTNPSAYPLKVRGPNPMAAPAARRQEKPAAPPAEKPRQPETTETANAISPLAK